MCVLCSVTAVFILRFSPFEVQLELIPSSSLAVRALPRHLLPTDNSLLVCWLVTLLYVLEKLRLNPFLGFFLRYMGTAKDFYPGTQKRYHLPVLVA